MSTFGEMPDQAWLVALLALPKMGPNRLRALLGEHDAATVWRRLCSGDPLNLDQVTAATVEEWRVAARSISVADRWRALVELGMSVAELGTAEYPERLRDDIEPPHVLFWMGAPIPEGPTVGIVGTRRCTSYGQRCAFELGAALANAGVNVVSGLALGIDAAAHEGALSVSGDLDSTSRAGTPIGVVGSGLDVVYPRRNAKLWNRVSEIGTLCCETAPGVGPAAWRFPARNRIIAGLSDALIVVESHERGGSLLTVDEAQLRDVPVGAVPGPITSSAARGSNRLLVDGATPVLEVDDIFAMIGFVPPTVVDLPGDLDDVASAVLDALGWTSSSLEQLCGRIALPPAQVTMELERLIADGIVARYGPWFERSR